MKIAAITESFAYSTSIKLTIVLNNTKKSDPNHNKKEQNEHVFDHIINCKLDFFVRHFTYPPNKILFFSLSPIHHFLSPRPSNNSNM